MIHLQQERLPVCPNGNNSPPRFGLGIDAGGTYTDVVLLDFDRDEVVQKAKALTTKWDYSVGIDRALDRLDGSLLHEVDLVAVSTTLATNSIVEGRQQKVGLLVMPPYGWRDLDGFRHNPAVVIDGQLEIDGGELAPVSTDQVRTLVRAMLDEQDVQAFAVAGYASHSNSAHELQVKAVIREETDRPVTCGHEVSEGLNYRLRAETAALNAGIIPYLESLFDRIGTCLAKRGITCPIMVVKSDGSLASLDVAAERPIETILSGPAASVAGVQHLTRHGNAIVVDMGGTTTDTATITDGVVRTCEEGAIVGGWETHVRALDMRTVGLGGDSLIALEKGELRIGPRRVAPVSWLADSHPGCTAALDWIERHAGYAEPSTAWMEMILLNDDDGALPLNEREQRVVEALRAGPCCLAELAERSGFLGWQLLPLTRIEDRHVVQRCGLTPTDLLHVAGRLELWDAPAAARIAGIVGGIRRTSGPAFATEVLDELSRRLAVEILKKQMDYTGGGDDIDVSPAARALVAAALTRRDGGLKVSLTLEPVVAGVGAPAHLLLPEAARLLNARAVVPTHADVANAIGAITSSVRVHKRVTISVDELGVYHLRGLDRDYRFDRLDDAEEHAIAELKRIVGDSAARAGTRSDRIEIVSNDSVGTTSDGAGIFLERVLEARLTGRPALA